MTALTNHTFGIFWI